MAPNGVAPTSTEITSRSSILVSTPTWLGKMAGTRRRTTRLIEREQPPAIKYDGRIRVVSMRPPLTPPATAAAKATHMYLPHFLPLEKMPNQWTMLTLQSYACRPGRTQLSRALPPHLSHSARRWILWQPRRFDPIIIIESSGVIQLYPFTFSSYDEVWTNTFNPKVKYSCLSDPSEGSLDAKVDTYVMKFHPWLGIGERRLEAYDERGTGIGV